MPEVSHSGHDESAATRVRRGDHLGVLHAAPWLRNRGDAGLGGRLEAIGEREKCVRGGHAALGAGTGFGAFTNDTGNAAFDIVLTQFT